MNALLGVTSAVGDGLGVEKRGNPEFDTVFVRQVKGLLRVDPDVTRNLFASSLVSM